MASYEAPSIYYDAGCGPCTFWARLTAGLARTPVEIHPLDGPHADRALRSLPPEARFAYAHLVEGSRTWTGADLMPAWVGILGGRTARRVAESASPVRWFLRSSYQRFWECRRSRGCATPPPPVG